MVKKAQARRNQPEKKMDLGWLRPGLAALTVAGTLAGLAMLLHWMKDPSEWPVRSVSVEGEFRHLEQEHLQARIAPLSESGFFAMEVGSIQRQVQQMPWVDQVSVRRVWPDRLNIEVREQRPVAHWGEHGFLNSRAEVFVPQQDISLSGLPRFEGVSGHERRVMDMYHSMQKLLEPLQLGVNSLRFDARRSWRMELTNGLEIKVGRNRPEQRVARFVRVYPAILATGKGQVKAVDLRYSNGFAVRWQKADQDSKGTG